MPEVVIVGGGISGLALAWQLQQLGLGVTLLERAARPGGVVGTLDRAGFRVETGPNGFLDNNPATFNLCRELGLAERLVPASEAARKNRFLVLRDRLRPLPSSLWSFLTSDVLSWRGKFALLTERYRRSRPTTADESIAEFARRRTNEEIAGSLVDAFVTGIHAGDPALLSVRAAFPRLATLEREHGSVMGGLARTRKRGQPPPRMWSFPEGLTLLTDTLAQRLQRPPLVGVAVRRLERQATGWRVRSDGTDSWAADAVALCCPAYQQAALLADVDPLLADEVGGIAYNRIAVIALGYRTADVAHPLDGFGYLSPGRDRRDILGVQWCSSIYPGRAPAGHVLLRALCGGWHRADLVSWDDDRLVSAVRRELELFLGVSAAPVFQDIVRWERAIPQYHLGHLERLARIEARRQGYPGLYLGGNAYRGVALNDCVEQAGVLARAIADQVKIVR